MTEPKLIESEVYILARDEVLKRLETWGLSEPARRYWSTYAAMLTKRICELQALEYAQAPARVR